MKKILIIVSLLFVQYSQAQEIKEVIKIEVGKECKASIAKRTYKDEIYTKPIKIVSSLNSVVTLMFSYKENFMYEDKGTVLNIWLNQKFILKYDSKYIHLKIDDKEFDLSRLIEFETYEKKIGDKTEVWFGLGFYINEELSMAFDNAKTIEMEMLNSTTHVRKNWEFSSSLVEEINETYDCFVQYYSPIDSKLIEERKIAQEEYEKNLVAFDNHYRTSQWGNTIQEVKSSQSDIPEIEDKDALAYNIKLNNDDFSAFYYFNENRLYQGMYILNEEYINENKFYSKYNEVKSILIGKYGAPKTVSKHRDKNLFDGVDEIGMAIQTGGYTEYSIWETKNSIIKLIIEGENFESKLTVRYITKDESLMLDVKKDEKINRTDGF